jgi:hypothetical protein
MDIRDTLKQENVFSELKLSEISKSTSEIPELSEIGKGKIDALKKSVQEINSLIQGREELSKTIFKEGEKIKTEINNFLLENESNLLADLDPRDLVREKNDLRHKKIQIAELQLNEKISSWKDVALLKKELRECERELTEKQERLNTITRILG